MLLYSFNNDRCIGHHLEGLTLLSLKTDLARVNKVLEHEGNFKGLNKIHVSNIYVTTKILLKYSFIVIRKV